MHSPKAAMTLEALEARIIWRRWDFFTGSFLPQESNGVDRIQPRSLFSATPDVGGVGEGGGCSDAERRGGGAVRSSRAGGRR
jgi:hypothetical protein